MDATRTKSSDLSGQTGKISKKNVEGKPRLQFTKEGFIVGEYAPCWSTRAGHFIRVYIPIDITDYRKVPQNFKDDVWNALLEEFDFGGIDPADIRESAELGFPQKFRSMKSAYRKEILRKVGNIQTAIAACPVGIDPGHWENFVRHEMKPEVLSRNNNNKINRLKNTMGHTLGRRTYAQLTNHMQKEDPEKKICRVEPWLRGHEKPDGSPLESAKDKYLLVKEAEAKRKNSSTDEGGSSTHINLNSDELAEVFGRDTGGRVRGVSSHISRKKLQQSVVTAAIVQQSNTSAYNDVKADVAELKNTITRVEGMMEAIYHKTYANSEPEVTQIPTDEILRTNEIGSNFINKESTISPTTYNVMLLDRDGNEVAKGFVVTDSTCGICHNRKVLSGEKKVYVEEVLIGGASVYDGPQDGNSLMEGFTDGGYLIWLEARLQKLS